MPHMPSLEDSADYKQPRNMVQIETLLRVVLVLMLVLIVALAGYFLLKFFQERNRPPRTYYEYQLAIWKNSLERYPKSPDVHTNLGYIYLKMGEDAKGVGYLNSALKINKKFAPALYNLGLFHKKKGNNEEAVKFLTKAGKLGNPGNKYLAYFTLGEAYVDMGKVDKAIDAFKQADEDNSTMWNTAYALGKLYEKKGDRELALKNYEKAALYNPDDAKLEKAIKRLNEEGSQ